MFRSHPLTCSGARRRLWIAVAPAAVLLATAATAQAAPFAYIAGDYEMDSQHEVAISQYEVVAGGLLAPMSPATVATGGEPSAVAVSPDGESVYVTNFNVVGGTVSQYDLSSDGALSPKSPPKVAAGPAPLHVAVSPDGQSVYVINDNVGTEPPSSAVTQFDVGPDGALSPKSPARVAAGVWSSDVTVSPDGQSVYVTDSFSPLCWNQGACNFDVRQYDVGPGGELSPKSPATVGSGGGMPRAVAVSPDGESVYVTNLCAERTNFCGPDDPSNVSQYDVGPGGELSPKSPATVATGDHAYSVTVSPDGESVYVASNVGWSGRSGYVSQYDVGPGGELSPKSPAKVATGGGATSVVMTTDGESAYVVNRHDASLSQYDVGAGGELSPKSPATMALSPSPMALHYRPSGMAVSPGAQPPLNCSVFASQAKAQRFFLSHGGPRRDRHALDGDDDGLACEARGAPYRGLLKVKYRAGHFTGRLKAVTGSCRGERRIKVYKKRNAPDRLVAKDRTKNRGFYKVQRNRPSNGKVYAKSRSKGKCQKDRSFRTLRF